MFVANTANEGMSRNLSESIATMLAAESVSLHQLLEARQFLEVPLAGMAAANADEQTIRDLEAAIADAEGGRRHHRPASRHPARRTAGAERGRPEGDGPASGVPVRPPDRT